MYQVKFQGIKQPVSNTSLTYSQKEGHGIGWDNPNKSIEIKNAEKSDFLAETKDLIYRIGLLDIVIEGNVADVLNSSYKQKDKIDEALFIAGNFNAFGLLAIVMQYWNRWGPLVPRKESQLAFHELKYYCLTGILWTEFWVAVNEDQCSPLTRKVIDSFFQSIKDIKNPPPYWSMLVYSETGQIDWKPVSQKKFNDNPMVPWIFIKHPASVSLRNRYKWFRKEIGRNILDYYSRQPMQYSPEIIGNTLYFKALTRNKFLVWVLETLKNDESSKLNLCRCGCGQELKGKSERWATPACKERVKNQNVDRRVMAWIRTKKNRGVITNEEFESYREEVKRCLKEGYSEESIRELLNKKIQLPN